MQYQKHVKMYGEAKKLHLIEEILKIENDSILSQLEAIINSNKVLFLNKSSFKAFAGKMTDDEVGELEKIIEEGCEKINEDYWK